MKYQFRYSLSKEDYLKFSEFQATAVNNKEPHIVYRWLAPIGFVILSLIQFQELDTHFFIRTAFYAVISILWIFIISKPSTKRLSKSNSAAKYISRQLTKLTIGAIKKSGKLPYGRETLTQFDEDFVISVTDGIETKAGYTSLDKIGVGDCAVYLFIDALLAIVIPYSVFETEEQRNEFLEYIKSKCRTE